MALLWTLIAGGCASSTGPSLIDELSTADLSERYPRTVKQTTRPGTNDTGRKFEIYPGDDNLREGPARQRPTGRGVRRAGDGYQLNFDNARLSEVAKVILGDTLKLPYYYDPRVQGQVTLATGGAVTREELLTVLETALKMNNAVLLNSDGSYRITPAADALNGDLGAFARTNEPGFGLSILPLRHVSAEAVIRLLENFVSKGGSLKAESTGNLLLIRGTTRERRTLMDVASSFDVDWLKGQSAGIFPLKHSTPDEMVADLTKAMNAGEGDLLERMVKFEPLHRLNAVLVLARQSSQLKEAGKWIRRLDRFNEAGQDLHVYRVEYGRAEDLASLLNETLGTGSGRSPRRRRPEIAPGRDILQLASRAKKPGGLLTRGGVAKVDDDPPPRATSRSTGRGSDAADAPDIRITADDVNNLLLIHASPSDYRRIAKALRKIDRPPLQVMINATIVEVTLNDTLRYGVQVFLKGKDLSGGVISTGEELPLVPNSAGLNFIIGALTDPQVVLDALADVTEVKVVSSPSVVVVDNQPAVLKVGDEVPISTQQATILENPDAPVVNSIQFRDTGVILKVIPRVNSTGLVTMDIEQEISTVVNQSTEETTLTPTIAQRQIASTISVYSGQMVVLGGLISEQHNKDKRGVPILNQIPVLGDIIGSTGKETRRTELIVFIRPQVIRNSRDARRVAEELRSRLKSLRPRRSTGREWQTEARH